MACQCIRSSFLGDALTAHRVSYLPAIEDGMGMYVIPTGGSASMSLASFASLTQSVNQLVKTRVGRDDLFLVVDWMTGVAEEAFLLWLAIFPRPSLADR